MTTETDKGFTIIILYKWTLYFGFLFVVVGIHIPLFLPRLLAFCFGLALIRFAIEYKPWLEERRNKDSKKLKKLANILRE